MISSNYYMSTPAIKETRYRASSASHTLSQISIRPDKTSGMLFLNDLDSFNVQKVRSGFIFHYHQNRSLKDSLFSNSAISSLSSMTPFLIYAQMMSKDIPYRQLTSLSPSRRLRSIVNVTSHGEKHYKALGNLNKV